MNRLTPLALLALPLALTGAAPNTTRPGCRAAVPADMAKRPASWLGGCVGGAASGLGVLRAGSGEPYDFFAGRMAAGKPVDGLLILGNGDWLVARGFDARGAMLPLKDATAEQFGAMFNRGAAGADLVARRMAAAGNPGSAAYYRRLAVRIRRAPPE